MLSLPIRDKLVRRCRPLLGTYVEISAPCMDAIAAGFAAIAEVQQLLSAHDDSSELAAISRLAHRQPVAISALTATVLDRALFWAKESAGSFDPTLGRLMAARGLLPQDDSLPSADHHANWRDVELDERSVRLARPLRLDLGGIAKGFAVDRAVIAMRTAGASCGLVNAGGDIRAFGSSPWSITIAAPGSRLPLGTVELLNAALATSADHGEATAIGSKHLAGASPMLASISVEASSAMDADALTKILMADSPHARHCLRQADATALRIFRDGRIIPYDSRHPAP
ncbi:FAD:protein FMN transferase [Sphingobium bisphenolivorans]|uniref:FAD:protein FMN transferase n=1 Tax=Sphingobium bisphenolivorans TaxID=1335760 RepID=UPI0003B6BE8C|nr:FAD:protein FMN transferase [Sphingobium bisphenolivorans]